MSYGTLQTTTVIVVYFFSGIELLKVLVSNIMMIKTVRNNVKMSSVELPYLIKQSGYTSYLTLYNRLFNVCAYKIYLLATSLVHWPIDDDHLASC